MEQFTCGEGVCHKKIEIKSTIKKNRRQWGKLFFNKKLIIFYHKM